VLPFNTDLPRIISLFDVTALACQRSFSPGQASMLGWSRRTHARVLLFLGWSRRTHARVLLFLGWSRRTHARVLLFLGWSRRTHARVLLFLGWSRRTHAGRAGMVTKNVGGPQGDHPSLPRRGSLPASSGLQFPCGSLTDFAGDEKQHSLKAFLSGVSSSPWSSIATTTSCAWM
jgi:hypothetical protein